jgi:hypothetical protein
LSDRYVLSVTAVPTVRDIQWARCVYTFVAVYPEFEHLRDW